MIKNCTKPDEPYIPTTLGIKKVENIPKTRLFWLFFFLVNPDNINPAPDLPKHDVIIILARQLSPRR